MSTQDPPRILTDDFDGGRELKDLVRDLKSEQLEDEGLDRVAAALPAGLAGPGAGGAATAGQAAAGQAVGASAVPVGMKVVGAVGVIGLAVAVGVYVESTQRPAPAEPPPERPVVEAAPEPEPEAEVAVPLDDPSSHRDEAPDPEPVAEGSRRRRPRVKARAAQEPSEAAAEAEAEVQARLEEDRLLREARGILPSNPRGALALTEEHRQRFPRGVLVQEREVVAVDALRRLSRGEEARTRAERFLSRWPNSAHRPRLESMGYH